MKRSCCALLQLLSSAATILGSDVPPPATNKPAPGAAEPLAASEFPPGWLPVDRLDDASIWQDHRRKVDHIQLYLPPTTKSVRGVFVCYVFHSSDPRELGRLWNFAVVTVPAPFEYDLGHNDKRNGRFQLGHPVGNMGFLLEYLKVAAKTQNRPELTTVPIVGWLGQNGAQLCADLYARAPDRVLAWGDAWYPNWLKYPDLVAKVPVASAWEFTKDTETKRTEERAQKLASVTDQPTPPTQLRCYASTYGFGHGIYSKYSFFVAYMDRCIKARMPDNMPEPGQPVLLKPIDISHGWSGDFNETNQWVAIAPVREAKGMIDPIWMPDAYAAWMWRAYHSAKPDVKLTGPVIEYRKGKDGKWGGPECGLGYDGPLKSGAALTFTATAPDIYTSVEFHDGDKIVGKADKAPWKADGVKLEPGLRVLFAVGVMADGRRSISHPGFAIVE